MTNLKELKELDAKATSAPWEARRNVCLCGSCEAGDIWRVDEFYGDCTVCKEVMDYHDHLLIAATRNALPDLIRVIELAEKSLHRFVNATDSHSPIDLMNEIGRCSVDAKTALSEIRKLKGE